jgi:hypothetical protein
MGDLGLSPRDTGVSQSASCHEKRWTSARFAGWISLHSVTGNEGKEMRSRVCIPVAVLFPVFASIVLLGGDAAAAGEQLESDAPLCSAPLLDAQYLREFNEQARLRSLNRTEVAKRSGALRATVTFTRH